MSGTPRHGRNGQIFIDCTTAGTQAVGTSTLTQLNSKNKWTFDQSPDFVDVTGFGDTSKTKVPGLPNAIGDITGNWDSAGSGTLLYNVINSTVERGIMIFPDYVNDLTQYISGKAFFGVKGAGGITEAVGLDLHFEGGPSGMTWTHP
jgi:hypothetical protein